MSVLEFLKSFLEFCAHNRAQVSALFLEHLWLVGVSMLLAVLIGLPLGILVTRHPRWNRPILGSANVVQTIPSLALLVLFYPLLLALSAVSRAVLGSSCAVPRGRGRSAAPHPAA